MRQDIIKLNKTIILLLKTLILLESVLLLKLIPIQKRMSLLGESESQGSEFALCIGFVINSRKQIRFCLSSTNWGAPVGSPLLCPVLKN